MRCEDGTSMIRTVTETKYGEFDSLKLFRICGEPLNEVTSIIGWLALVRRSDNDQRMIFVNARQSAVHVLRLRFKPVVSCGSRQCLCNRFTSTGVRPKQDL